MNPLLASQLLKHLPGQQFEHPGWPAFLAEISATYGRLEQDRQRAAAAEKPPDEAPPGTRRTGSYFEETLNLQPSLTFRAKKVGGHYVYDLCRGNLLASLGIQAGQMEGQTLEHSPWDGSVRFLLPHFERAWNGEAFYFESEMAEGSTTYLTYLQPVRAAGSVTEILGFTVDITGTKSMEKELRASESYLHAVLDNIQTGVLIVDEQTQEIYDVNIAALKMLDRTREAVVGRVCQGFVYPAERERGADAPPHQRVENAERVLLRADGSTLAILKTVVPTILRNRRYRLESFVDISERKRMEAVTQRANADLNQRSAQLEQNHVLMLSMLDDLEKSRAALQLANERARQLAAAAQAANHAKSEFLATMSHELRTPLNAIIGFSEILRDGTFGALNPKQTRYADNVLTAGRHLLSLINDILDLSKVEAGKMKLALAQVNLREVLNSALMMVRETALKHNLTLELEAAADLVVQADERKLKQILFNLLSNATKFTPDGGRITVTAERQAQALCVRVADTGIGIKPEDQATIFGEFVQVDSTYGRKHQGTGLGLALCRKLLDLHGGRIWMESAGEGQGSTFWFTLPLTPPAAEAAPQVP